MKLFLSLLYNFYEIPMLRDDYIPQQGDCTLWWNLYQGVLDLGAGIWLGFAPVHLDGQPETKACCAPDLSPKWSILVWSWCTGQLGNSSWWGRLGSRGYWILLLLSPAKLAGSSGGCTERRRWQWWVRDDFLKTEGPSQCGSSTSEGITRAVCCSSGVENNCVSHGQQLVSKTQSKLGSWKAHLKLKYCFCFYFWVQLLSLKLRGFLMFSFETVVFHARQTRLK